MELEAVEEVFLQEREALLATNKVREDTLSTVAIYLFESLVSLAWSTRLITYRE